MNGGSQTFGQDTEHTLLLGKSLTLHNVFSSNVQIDLLIIKVQMLTFELNANWDFNLQDQDNFIHK